MIPVAESFNWAQEYVEERVFTCISPQLELPSLSFFSLIRSQLDSRAITPRISPGETLYCLAYLSIKESNGWVLQDGQEPVPLQTVPPAESRA